VKEILGGLSLLAVLRFRITLMQMQIRILLVTWMRIRILLATWMWILILLVTLMRIRILIQPFHFDADLDPDLTLASK
jgi:hypothetical protein